jgi:hypothetical protein
VTWPNIQKFAERNVLYLITIGRRTGLQRQIEIWFVGYRCRFYLFAEAGEDTAWVKNIRNNREVMVQIEGRQN